MFRFMNDGQVSKTVDVAKYCEDAYILVHSYVNSVLLWIKNHASMIKIWLIIGLRADYLIWWKLNEVQHGKIQYSFVPIKRKDKISVSYLSWDSRIDGVSIIVNTLINVKYSPWKTWNIVIFPHKSPTSFLLLYLFFPNLI